MDLPSAELRRRLRRSLLNWFRRSHRDLPWRRNRDPYHIWVSEIMLQQTQVTTVIPFFERFLRAFPTIQNLAAADEQEVLRLWEGLGYYRRARDLHRAARVLVTQHGGAVPDDPAVLRSLPGIGRYTVGAVLSQAFGRRLPILEANSQRVLCRLLGLDQDPRREPVKGLLWRVAETLLPASHAGDFNQALMELGALVCTAASPGCSECPLAALCIARRLGRQEQIPARAEMPRPIGVREAAVVVRRGARVLLARRPRDGRWAGLWEFPHAALHGRESFRSGAVRVLPQLTGVQAEIKTELLTIRHSVNHHRITLVCFDAHYRAGDFRSDFYRQGKWLKPADVGRFPVSTPQRKLAQALIDRVRQKSIHGDTESNHR